MNADDNSPRPPRPHRTPRQMYRIEESIVPAPKLPGTVAARATIDDIIDTIAAELVLTAEMCVREYGDFHLALSGGSTPQPLYERLMYDPNCRRLPWERTHLWIVDERCVPFDDDRSNFKMINETIVDHTDIPPDQVHPIFATAENPDSDYENRIKAALMYREKSEDRLDYVLLGMGADGHTASLFPGTAALAEKNRLVRKIHYDKVDPPDRVTMTFPLINAARVVSIFVTGKSKTAMINRIATGNDTVQEIPIKGVNPRYGELKWYLDADAAGVNVDNT